jgi:hypothetical protein
VSMFIFQMWHNVFVYEMAVSGSTKPCKVV